MPKNKLRLKYILPIILALVFVGVYYFFLRANPSPQVSFTADTILNLEGIAAGDLYIAQNSACSSLDIAGKDLTVTAIPDGESFILKSFKHDQALKITPTAGTADLSFSADNLLWGDVNSWRLSSPDAAGKADVVWGVPAADTWYMMKVDGENYKSFKSNAASEIAFIYEGGLLATKTFTLLIDINGGNSGGSFIAPKKPDVSRVKITDAVDGGLSVENIPEKVVQVAISPTGDFTKIGWEYISQIDVLSQKYAAASRLYIKFRTQSGGVSDVINYYRGRVDVVEGDIVKTKDSFDVYILKYKSNKPYKRLILSPSVFESYRHLKWENIKVIPQTQMDEYTTSALVKETNDTVIYELFPAGDTGTRKSLDTSKSYDANSVYEINRTDRDSYVLVR